MVIRQGDVFWTNLPIPTGSEPGYRRPCVVVQSDMFNDTGINTIVACSITTNLSHAEAPGNVFLMKGEGGLPRSSVVNVTMLAAIDRNDFMQKIGHLSNERLQTVLEGVCLLIGKKVSFDPAAARPSLW